MVPALVHNVYMTVYFGDNSGLLDQPADVQRWLGYKQIFINILYNFGMNIIYI